MALVRLGAAVNTDVELGRMAAAPTVLRFLLDESVERLDVADRGAMQQCTLLTKFSASIAEVLGRPGLLVRVAAAGVPISTRNDGWLEFPVAHERVTFARRSLRKASSWPKCLS